MLTPEATWQVLESHLQPLESQTVERQAAVGHILAQDLTATVDMPPADVSAMDGYALAGEPRDGRAPVVAVAAAGAPLDRVLQPGEAAKIMTGAVVPEGADRVVPVEKTDGGQDTVTVHAVPVDGAHIRRGGEVIRTGDPLIAAGTHLTPGAISYLASHGYVDVPVHRRPRVAVLPTGNEVIPPDQEPGPGQLRDSNSPFLRAAGQSLGLEIEPLGIAPDDIDAMRATIAQGLENDVLLLSGGVSMGDYDFVEDILEELDCELLVDAVAIQPGKPFVAARQRSNGRWVFGLPGNPASVMVTFWIFVRPVLRRLAGMAEDGFWHGALDGELAAPLPKGKDRDRFLPAEVEFRQGKLFVTPRAPQGSHDVACYSGGSALVRIYPEVPAANPGDPCSILPLVDWAR